MNKEKHIGMSYAIDLNKTKKINDLHVKDLNKNSVEIYEVFSSKRKNYMDVPIQVGCAVYDLANMDISQRGNSQPGFVLHAVSSRLRANNYTMFSGF